MPASEFTIEGGNYQFDDNGELTVQVTLMQTVTQRMVDDIMCAAFEGGVNYWCSHYNPVIKDTPGGDYHYLHEALTRGWDLNLHDGEDDEWHLLTLDKFISGLIKWCQLVGKTPERFHDDHDADDADNVIQYAIFGKGVYG